MSEALEAESWLDEARRAAAAVRVHAFRIAQRQGGGYFTQTCCAAEVLVTLYLRLMRLGQAQPVSLTYDDVPIVSRRTWGGLSNGSDDPSMDRFILSAAHYATAVYATLVEVGRLEAVELETFAADRSTLEMIGAEYSPGIEVTGGSLGQALSVAIGRALARSRRGDRGRMWVLMSDGELQEGQTWEALMVAGHHRLSNLTVIVDANGYQVDGPTSSTIGLEPIATKAAAFGWDAREIDGHDLVAIDEAGSRPSDRPVLVIARTEPWRDVPSLASRHPRDLHFIRFRGGEQEAVAADLGVSPW